MVLSGRSNRQHPPIAERQIREYIGLLKALPIRVEARSMAEPAAVIWRLTMRRICIWRSELHFLSAIAEGVAVV
jgi:hypothetical protein